MASVARNDADRVTDSLSIDDNERNEVRPTSCYGGVAHEVKRRGAAVIGSVRGHPLVYCVAVVWRSCCRHA
jgi:hypothetical protein